MRHFDDRLSLDAWSRGKFENSLVCPHCFALYRTMYSKSDGLFLAHICGHKTEGKLIQDAIFLGHTIDEVQAVLDQDPLRKHCLNRTSVGYLHARDELRKPIKKVSAPFDLYDKMPSWPQHEVMADIYLHSGRVPTSAIQSIMEGAMRLLEEESGMWIKGVSWGTAWVSVPYKLAIKIFIDDENMQIVVDASGAYGVKTDPFRLPIVQSAKLPHSNFSRYLRAVLPLQFIRNVACLEAVISLSVLNPQ